MSRSECPDLNNAANMWAALNDTARKHPQRAGIIHGDEQLSYAAWQQRALEHATALQQQRIAPGERVLLWLEPSTEMAAALFGIWATGAIAVLIDPKARQAHVQHAIDITDCAFIMYNTGELPPADSRNATLIDVTTVPAVSGPPEPAVQTDAGAAASIVFTSGSTGPPKGVTQSHANLITGANTVASYLAIDASDRLLCPVPWAFDYGCVQLQISAVTGASHILPAPANPFGICAAIEQHRPTVLPGVPSLFAYLLQGVSPFRQTDLSSLRLLTNTGGTIPAPVLKELLALVGNAEVCLNYGLTESYRTSYLAPALIREKPGSIGKAIPGVDVAIVRPDGTLADVGETGEIVHCGKLIFLHYWGNPEATARSLRPDPLQPDSNKQALFTGDLGRLDKDGFLYYEGRRDRQLKVMGVRVSPEEIEGLLHASGLIRDVAIFGIPHELLDREVCAAVVPTDSEDKELRKKLLSHARATMTQNMTPRRFLILEQLPKTTTGKTDYLALEAIAANSG